MREDTFNEAKKVINKLGALRYLFNQIKNDKLDFTINGVYQKVQNPKLYERLLYIVKEEYLDRIDKTNKELELL